MLASLICNFIFGRKPTNSLNCGIFAWTGTSSDKFSPLLFNYLGTANDSRGGDSCGVYYNRGAITGIGTDAKYESLIKSHRLHTTVKPGKWPVVIGHCRKASVGAVTSNNIQPVLLRNEAKGGKLVYVQAHNGTISNHRELAKKYNVEAKNDESDSVLIAKLIEQEGFKILGEYEGSAALVMHFVKEPNVLYAFHGESKNYYTLTEERPLHYVQIKGSGTYISSESQPLEWIANGDKATSFKYNVVYKLQGDNIEEFMKIDREKAVLRKYVETTKTTNYYDSEAYNQNEIPFNINRAQQNLGVTHRLFTLGITKNICACDVKSLVAIGKTEGRIRYEKGMYCLNGSAAHGEVVVDTWGYVRDKYEKSIAVFYLYFYYGILLIDKGSFEAMEDHSRAFNIKGYYEFYDRALFSRMSDALYNNALLPYTRRVENPGSGYMEQTGMFNNDKAYKNETFYCGSFSPLFSDTEFHFMTGDCIGFERLSSTYTIADLLEEYGYLDDIGFGKKPEEDKNNNDLIIDVKSCSECVSKGYYKNGDRCVSCTHPLDKVVDENNADAEVTLMHTIGSQLTPIVDDMDSLIDEIESSGYQYLVEDKHKILVEVNNKLKEITL
jgi:hypothetical protein